MHYTLAFHVPYEVSLKEREEQISAVYEGEMNRFDGLNIIGFDHGHSDKPWEHFPYAFIDSDGSWHEKDEGPHFVEQKEGPPKEVDWQTLWMHHIFTFVFSSPHGEALIAYADCHR